MNVLEAVCWWLLQHPSVVVVATLSIAGGLLASIVVRVRAGGEHVCRLVDRPGVGWDEHPEELAALAAEARAGEQLHGVDPVPPAAPGEVEPTATGRCRACDSAVVHRRVPDGAWWTHVVPADHRVVIDRSSLRFSAGLEETPEDLEATRRLSWAAYGLGHAMPPPGGGPGGYRGRHHRPGSAAVTG